MRLNRRAIVDVLWIPIRDGDGWFSVDEFFMSDDGRPTLNATRRDLQRVEETMVRRGSRRIRQSALRAASSTEASMLSKFLLSIVSITGPISRPMGPPLGTYR